MAFQISGAATFFPGGGGAEGQLTRTHNPCKKGVQVQVKKVKSLNLYNNVIFKKTIFSTY